MKKSTISLLCFLSAVLGSVSAFAQEKNDPIKVEDFVRQMFIEGIPYEQAIKYDASNVLTLTRMLSSSAEKEHWANAAVMLGIIGGEEGVEPMIAFIEFTPESTMDIASYRAKTSAIMALGYVINRTGSKKALDYLAVSLDMDSWEKRGFRGIAPYQKDKVERNKDLVRYAILGLALSGDPRAAAELQSFHKRAAAGSTELQKFEAESQSLIKEALKENRKIAERGLLEYYRSKAR